MKKMLMLEEEEKGNIPEEIMVNANSVVGFRLLFLGKNESQRIHKVELRNINFHDLMRHLQRGESVLITPKLLKNSTTNAKKQDQGLWYFARM